MSDTRVSDIVTIVEEERAAGRRPAVLALCGGDEALAAAVEARLRELAGFPGPLPQPPPAGGRPTPRSACRRTSTRCARSC